MQGKNHSFKNRLGPAGRTGPTRNRWLYWVEPHIGSVMQLDRWKPVRLGENRTEPVTRSVFKSNRFLLKIQEFEKKLHHAGIKPCTSWFFMSHFTTAPSCPMVSTCEWNYIYYTSAFFPLHYHIIFFCFKKTRSIFKKQNKSTSLLNIIFIL